MPNIYRKFCVTFSENIILDTDMTDQELCHYVGLNMYCGIPGGYISIKGYVASIYGTIDKQILKSVKEIIKNIKYINYNDGDLISLDCNLDHSKYYATISQDNFLRLMCGNRRNKYSLIRFLLLLNLSTNHKEETCNMPESYFASKMNCSIKTISSYIKALEEENIINVQRTGVKERNIYSLVDKNK